MNIHVDISIDFLWKEKHFIKDDWGSITYMVGANGTGKTVVAEELKERFRSNGLKVRYFGAERISALVSKSDPYGFLGTGGLDRGFDIGSFSRYKKTADTLGQSIDAFIEIRNKLDLQIKIESILSDIFGKKIVFEEIGGFLNVKMQEKDQVYDLKKQESHGLKEIITLLTFLYDDEYNCIILDEPELNLHPQFQQFVLQEIKALAGNPFQDPQKKMFVILTHSPYMISVQNADELKNVVIFHKNDVPTFIADYSELDNYQRIRLDRLLLRMNVNQKTFFFAEKPVFVEGYTDQQLFTTIQYKRHVPLGALGVSFIDVGGKDEVDIMFSLCRLLKMDAYCIVDLDALFEGKLRQTADKMEVVKQYLANNGRRSLMEEIGEMETLLSRLVSVLTQIDTSCIQNEETRQLIATLQAQTGDKKAKMQRRILAIGMHRDQIDIASLLDEELNISLARCNAIQNVLQKCLVQVSIFVLEKGSIENYFQSRIENPYQISDSSKTSYYEQEARLIAEEDKMTLEEKCPEIVNMLNFICREVQINTEKTLSKKLGDLIHQIQSILHEKPETTLEELTKYPELHWNSYKRIVEITDLSKHETQYCCSFRVLRDLSKNKDRVYSFTADTVAASFTV